MTKKISQLPSATALDGTEFIPVVQGGVTKQSTVASVTRSTDGIKADLASTASPILGDYLVGVKRTGGTATTVHDFIEALPLSVKDFGAVGDGITDDTTALKAAILAAAGKTLKMPGGTYLFNPSAGITTFHCKLVGDGKQQSILSITGTGDLFQRSAYSVLEDLTILMNGATYSGHACKFAAGASNQVDRNIEIFNVASGKQALLFAADGGNAFYSSGSTYYTLTPVGTGAAVKFGADTSASARTFVGAQSAGCTLYDFGAVNDVFVFGGYTAGLVFSSSASAKALISSVRIGSAGGSITIDGASHEIVGCVFSDPVIFAATSATCRLDSEVASYNITDNGTGNAFTIQNKVYTPGWTGDSSDPAIVDGTLTGNYSVKERKVTAAISITMGASTTFGTGGWRIGLPYTIASGVSPVGSVRALDSGTNFKVGTCVGVAGTTYCYVYFDAAVNTARSTIPFTWAVNDILNVQLSYDK